MTLHGKDERIIRENVRRTSFRLPQTELGLGNRRIARPCLGRSKKDLAKYESHLFVLLAGRPDVSLEESVVGSKLAIASCPIAKDSDCLLINLVGQASQGYWLAIPCDESKPVEHEKCINLSDGKFPLPEISIENLADTATEPQFNGWAAKMKGRHQMEMIFPPTPTGPDLVDFVQCNPAVRIQVPNNARESGNVNWPTGPIVIEWQTEIPIALLFQAGTRALGGGRVTVNAQLSENGADPYPRDADNNKLVAESKYDDWRGSAAGGSGLGDADLLAWLANGTFTIYPMS